MSEPPVEPSTPELSRRAALRIIQRAFVLAGRDRSLRQKIRQARISTLWEISDWDFRWTVEFDRSRVRFERRPVKRPDATLIWPTAAEFFRQVDAASLSPGEVVYQSQPEMPRLLESVCQCFCTALKEVIANPVDENGDPLVSGALT